jgi:hypothetical protein
MSTLQGEAGREHCTLSVLVLEWYQLCSHTMANRSASELDSVTDRVEEKELDAGKVKEAMSSLVANDVADRAEEKARCVVVPPRRSVLFARTACGARSSSAAPPRARRCELHRAHSPLHLCMIALAALLS